MFVERNTNTCLYEPKNLFLLFNGPFCPVSHKQVLISFAGARRFTVGLFSLIKFIINKLRKVVFIPVGLIKKAYSDGWLKSLAYFVRMKSLYWNNTHYKFSLRRLGDKVKLSPAALSYHMRVLKENDLICYHSGNVTFRGYRKLSTLFGGNHIGIPVNFENQYDIVRAQLIRFNLAQQEYNIRKSGVQKCPNRHQTPNNFSERMNSCYTGLSAAGFGKVLDLSPAQGSAIRRRLIDLGILSHRRRYSNLFSLRGPSGGSCGRLKELKRQGLVPYYARLAGDKVTVERRMELWYEGIS